MASVQILSGPVIFDAEFDSAIKTTCLIRNEHNEHCSALNLSDLAVAYIDRLKRYGYVSPSHEPYSYLISGLVNTNPLSEFSLNVALLCETRNKL